MMSHDDMLPKLSIINRIPTWNSPPAEINVVVEIPKDSKIKYEIDPNTGILFVDRKLSASMVYPFNYGFIPNAEEEEEDGKPVDILRI